MPPPMAADGSVLCLASFDFVRCLGVASWSECRHTSSPATLACRWSQRRPPLQSLSVRPPLPGPQPPQPTVLDHATSTPGQVPERAPSTAEAATQAAFTPPEPSPAATPEPPVIRVSHQESGGPMLSSGVLAKLQADIKALQEQGD